MWKWDANGGCVDAGERVYPRLLAAAADKTDRRIIKRLLQRIFGENLHLEIVANWDEAVDAVRSGCHDIYLVDQFLGAGTGIELIASFARADNERVFILVSGQESRAVDLEASRAGAADYLVKAELDESRLERSLRYAWETLRQKRLLIDQTTEPREAESANAEDARNNFELAEALRKMQSDLGQALVRAENGEKQFRWLAQHDLLTGLPNRSLFIAQLNKDLANAERSGRSMALYMIDLDRFKLVNDSHGQRIGDGLLVQFATRLSRFLRRTDTLARLGGDEFAIITTNLDRDAAASVTAEKIIDSVAEPFIIDSHHINSAASVGIVIFDGREPVTPDELLQRADFALYRAKEAGRQQYQFFDEDLNRSVRRGNLLKKELAAAIGTDQIHLVFQPKIDIATKTIKGAEALTRWTHPELGPISPAEFIPIAEMTGQILDLSDWALETAFKTIGSWRGTVLETVPIALNVSAVQLKSGDIVNTIQRLMRRYGVLPRDFALEITETTAIEDLEGGIDRLTALRDMGVEIAIDDFGTGYSSLALATTLPADQLKIDKSFVSGMLKRSSDAAAVNATITLAHSLGMSVVAEGVETMEEFEYLDRSGCDQVQGFLIVKPLGAEELVTWYALERDTLLRVAA